jgi:hypothetical protein
MISQSRSRRGRIFNFLTALRDDLRRELARAPEETASGAGDWAHPDLEGYLNAWAGWLEDLTRDSPQWPLYGRTLESLDPRARRDRARGAGVRVTAAPPSRCDARVHEYTLNHARRSPAILHANERNANGYVGRRSL